MTQYFIKLPSNFFRIPESRYFRQHAAGDVYEFLLDMAYRREEPLFNNKSHVPSKMMADAWKKGKLTCFTTVSLIEKYRGLSKNTVKDALKKLYKLGLIKLEKMPESGLPHHRDGLLYILGNRIRDDKGKFTQDAKTFLDKWGEMASNEDGAREIQFLLIETFNQFNNPMHVFNLRFHSVDTKLVKTSKKPSRRGYSVIASNISNDNKDINGLFPGDYRHEY